MRCVMEDGKDMGRRQYKDTNDTNHNHKGIMIIHIKEKNYNQKEDELV